MSSRKPIMGLFNNWPAKMLSVAIALMLFVFHRMSTLATRTLSAPLIIETSSMLVPASPYPQNVRINMRGEDDSIRAILDGDIEAFADFRKYEAEGYYRAPIQIRKKGSALGVEPLEISVNPLEVVLQLDIRGSQTIPVVADIQGKVASGFDFVDHTVSPAEIVVSGPMGVLENLLEIKTEPIVLDGRRSDFTIEVSIAKDNPFLSFRGNGMVEFQGRILPSVPVRNIDNIPIAPAGLNPRFKIESGGITGSVRLEGSYYQIDAFSPEHGLLSVDCSRISATGTYTLPVVVDLPAGLFLIRQEPEELVVVVTLVEGEAAVEREGEEAHPGN